MPFFKFSYLIKNTNLRHSLKLCRKKQCIMIDIDVRIVVYFMFREELYEKPIYFAATDKSGKPFQPIAEVLAAPTITKEYIPCLFL